MSDSKVSRRSFLGGAAIAGAVAAGAALTGCGSSSSSGSKPASAAASTAKAAAAAAKPVILVVSFGTSFNDSRNITIGAIESTIRERFPEYDVRRAFTAQIIIDKLKDRDGIIIPNFKEAMDQIVADGVSELIVQPTHLMHGFEYTDIANDLKDYEGKIAKMVLSEPLLNSDDDFDRVIKAITEATSEYDDGQTAICFMGHGTEAESNAVYAQMQEMITAAGHKNYFIATVEATPTFEDAINAAKAAGLTKAVLEPLMVVAGDHANNDMADEEDPESFASQFKAAGFEVTSLIRGLGQLEAIDMIYVDHVKAAQATL